MADFQNKNKSNAYFEGWYLKHQNSSDTIAFIPAFHIDQKGHALASLQVITNDISHNVPFSYDNFLACSKSFFIRLGNCTFSRYGCRLNLKTKELEIKGRLTYGPWTPPLYDIMGPFRFIPFMECRHSVFSLYHKVNGELTINGKKLLFHNDSGYIEGDRGISFPYRYLWTQCTWGHNCIMISVAHIPFLGGSFTGCIGFIYLDSKEHRIATYLGVKILQVSEKIIYLLQGKMKLRAELLESYAHPLQAPCFGSMIRTIHESPACSVRYTLSINNRIIFDFINKQASFENNWNSGSGKKTKT